MAKLLSSRENSSLITTLQNLIIMMDNEQGVVSEIPDTPNDMSNELVSRVIDLIDRVKQQESTIQMLNLDVLGLLMDNHSLRYHAEAATAILGIFNAPLLDSDVADAEKTLTAHATASYNPDNGAVELSFTPKDLRLGIEEAIHGYISHTLSSISTT